MDDIHAAAKQFCRQALTDTAMDRRHCLTGIVISGLSIAISGCATIRMFSKNSHPGEKEFYNNELYPNDIFSYRMDANFRQMLSKTKSFNATPGIDFRCIEFIAAAPGKVIEIDHDLMKSTGRLGGKMVTIGHPEGLAMIDGVRRWPIFKTYYAHLSKLTVQLGDYVERGQTIGYNRKFHNHSKFIVSVYNNYANPSRFGQQHGIMKFFNEEPIMEKNYETVHESLLKQIECLNKLDESRKDYEERDIFESKMHIPTGKKTTHWSYPEKFAMLEYIYRIDPGYFATSNEQFQELRDDFYSNQALILTVPYKK